MNDDFTAKHFRTGDTSVLAFEALGNTPAIARTSHVHPMLIALVKEGDQAALRARPLPRAAKYLSRAERRLIAPLDSGAKEKRELKLAA